MSFLTGASGTNASTPTRYTGIKIQTSAQGIPIAIIWGKNRASPNLIWYNNFQSHKQSNKGGGGKGGSKGSGNYTYTAAVMLALCEGPIYGIAAVWVDQTEYFTGGLAKLGLSICGGASGPPYGTASQPVWPYLTSNYPSQALAYAYTVYLSNSNYNLGASAALPNHSFEVEGIYCYDYAHGSTGQGDINPGFIIPDFLTNPQYSLEMPAGVIDATSLAFYQTYCTAQGLAFSPVLDTQEQVSQIVNRWAALSNSWIFWSGGSLKFVPLGDSAITANGVTYTPNLTVQFNLTYDDFLEGNGGRSSGSAPSTGSGGGPIQVTRADPADCPNHVKIEIKDRGNGYNSAPVEWQDQGLVDQFGQIDAQVTQAHEICDLDIAGNVAQLLGQRAAYIRNTYAFKLGSETGSFVEPGDIVSLTDPHLGLSAFPVRVRSADEDEAGAWAITAEELPAAIGTV